jgi:hypothetical protein
MLHGLELQVQSEVQIVQCADPDYGVPVSVQTDHEGKMEQHVAE